MCLAGAIINDEQPPPQFRIGFRFEMFTPVACFRFEHAAGDLPVRPLSAFVVVGARCKDEQPPQPLKSDFGSIL